MEDLNDQAALILSFCKNRYFFAFYGSVGAGKTTMIKAICKRLGSKDTVSSPTYALVNEYEIPEVNNKNKVYHIDLYRLKSAEEALDIDIESYFYDENAYVFVEWPELIQTIIPSDAVALSFEKITHNKRKVKLNDHE